MSSVASKEEKEKILHTRLDIKKEHKSEIIIWKKD